MYRKVFIRTSLLIITGTQFTNAGTISVPELIVIHLSSKSNLKKRFLKLYKKFSLSESLFKSNVKY